MSKIYSAVYTADIEAKNHKEACDKAMCLQAFLRLKEIQKELKKQGITNFVMHAVDVKE